MRRPGVPEAGKAAPGSQLPPAPPPGPRPRSTGPLWPAEKPDPDVAPQDRISYPVPTQTTCVPGLPSVLQADVRRQRARSSVVNTSSPPLCGEKLFLPAPEQGSGLGGFPA